MGNVTIATGGGQGTAGVGGSDAGAAAGFGNAQQGLAANAFMEKPSSDTAKKLTESFGDKKPTDEDLTKLGMSKDQIADYKKLAEDGKSEKAGEAKKAGGGGGAKKAEEDPMEELIKKLMKGPPQMSREAAMAKAKELTEKAGGDPAKALKDLEASQKGADGANAGGASPSAAGGGVDITISGSGK